MSGGALWSVDAMATTMRAQRAGALPDSVSGVSIDSRTLARGEAFFAIAGDNRDGHDFVPRALSAGAALAVIAASRRAAMPDQAPLLVVPDDVLGALNDLARAARLRSNARIAGVTGSVGKTGTKEALRHVLAGQAETHASVASYNNHWGVPLSLARLAVSARFGVFELGMNHAGEITPLTLMVRPHVAIVTTVAPVHLEFFGSVEAIADAKAEYFVGVEANGAAVIGRDHPYFARLAEHAAAAGVARIVSFGENADADARLIEVSLGHDHSVVRADILGTKLSYRIGSPGRHVVRNSLGVLAATALLGGDVAAAARALASLEPPKGRGRPVTLAVPGGRVLLIDESYNANPASMRAALALLAQAEVGPQGRRIAVLGDMRELGLHGARLHAELAEPIAAEAIDLVFCAGPLMAALWEVLPKARRGGYAPTSAELVPHVLGAIRAGDAVMVKGSLMSRMGPLVTALTAHFSSHEAARQAAAQG